MLLFRILAVLIGLYMIYLYTFRFSSGMLPVWSVILLFFIGLSFPKVYHLFFGIQWFRLLFVFGICVLFFTEMLIFYVGSKTKLSEECDYVIVLGAAVRGEQLSLALRSRVEKAVDYLNLHPETKVIVSGGQGPGEDITEAVAMEGYLLEKGIKQNRIIKEDQSTSTRENLAFSYQFIEENKKVMVISSRFHILRAQTIAKKMGKSIKGIGTDTFIMLVPNYYIREFFGLIYELTQ